MSGPSSLPALFDEVPGDIKSLPTAAQKVAIRILLDLRAGTVRGEPLGNMPSTGDLSGCYKIYFDDEPGRLHRRYRVVYREVGGQLHGVAVEVVAVGHKRLLEVYALAAERLGQDRK